MSTSLRGQLGRFLIVGSCTVAIDFVAYRLLLVADVPFHLAKATSFVIATAVAYLLNKAWTFGHPGGVRPAWSFAALYACTLLVNVSVNAGALAALRNAPGRIVVAFLIAQATSTTLNFLGMRFVVFRPAA